MREAENEMSGGEGEDVRMRYQKLRTEVTLICF